MEQKWSDRFNRLEALLLAKTMDQPQEPTVSAVKVTPTHAHWPTSLELKLFWNPQTSLVLNSLTDLQLLLYRPLTLIASGVTDQSTVQRQISGAFDITRKDTSSSDSHSESVTSDRPPVDLYPDLYPEEGELSDDHEVSFTDPDQSLSEEQSYRETMRGILSYMGWTHIPDVNSGTKMSDDNPFAGPKLHPAKFLSISLRMNGCATSWALVQGYPSRTAEAGTLQRDQFVRLAKSQTKWYGLRTETEKDSSDTVKSWNTGSSRLNSTYLRIARQAGIAANPPLCRPISQENLRKWERSARESSIIWNQAAGFNRCLLKVQQNMQTQLRAIRTEFKGKAASRVSSATDELQFLFDFNSSVCHAMAKAMEHLTDFVFVNMANTTLLRRDSYLSYLKAGVKVDTLNALRSAPLELDTLFPDSIIKQVEEDIAAFDRNHSGSVYKTGQKVG